MDSGAAKIVYCPWKKLVPGSGRALRSVTWHTAKYHGDRSVEGEVGGMPTGRHAGGRMYGVPANLQPVKRKNLTLRLRDSGDRVSSSPLPSNRAIPWRMKGEADYDSEERSAQPLAADVSKGQMGAVLTPPQSP